MIEKFFLLIFLITFSTFSWGRDSSPDLELNIIGFYFGGELEKAKEALNAFRVQTVKEKRWYLGEKLWQLDINPKQFDKKHFEAIRKNAHENAKILLEDSASVGIADAQYRLARLYDSSSHFRSEKLATTWYEVASKNGSDEATKYLNDPIFKIEVTLRNVKYDRDGNLKKTVVVGPYEKSK